MPVAEFSTSTGRTNPKVKDKLEALHADLTAGIEAPDGRYTVHHAIEDWLRDGLDGRAEKTITLNRGALKPFADRIGKKPPRELTAQDVRHVLTGIAATRLSRAGDTAAFTASWPNSCVTRQRRSWSLLLITSRCRCGNAGECP